MCGQERAIALGTIAKKLASQDFAKAFAALATCAHIQPSKAEAQQHALLHLVHALHMSAPSTTMKSFARRVLKLWEWLRT